MEEEIKIPLKNKNIFMEYYGVIENSLIIFVHGFTGHKMNTSSLTVLDF